MKRLLLTLLLALSIGVGAAWAESYTVTFKTGTGSSKLTTGSNASTAVDDNSTKYLTAKPFTSATQAIYATTDGLRLGAGSNLGNITIAIAEDYQVSPTSIKVVAKRYSSDTSQLKIEACGESLTTGNLLAEATSYELKLDGNTKLTEIKFSGSGKRLCLISFTVEYSTGPVSVEENLTLSPLEFDVNLSNEYVINVSPSDFVEDVTALGFTYEDSEIFEFFKSGTNSISAYAYSAGETNVTLTWSDGDKYLAGTKTFKVKVNLLKPTLSYSAPTCEIVLDEKPYALPELTADTKGLDVVYSSSNEDVAKFVDGELVIGLPGTTTITAKIAAVAGQNEGAEASYELTVKSAGAVPNPTFSIEDGKEVPFGTEVTVSATKGELFFGTIEGSEQKQESPYTFTLNTIGEVTYYAYAKTDNGQSETAHVTYTVVKADVDFGFEQSEYTVKMGTMPSELPVPSASLNYTLSSSNTSVASLDPVLGSELWLLAPGDTEITATYAGDSATNPATAKYILHVIEEGTPATDASVTFNFLAMTNEKYGLDNAETEDRSGQTYFKTGATAKQGDVTIVLNKKNNTNGWRILNDKDLRIYTGSDASMTISVGSGIITSIDFNGANSGTITKYTVNGGAVITPDVMTRFTVDCSGLNTGTIIFAPTVGKNGVIGNVTVNYTIPGIPAKHTSANLEMMDDREVLIDDETEIDGANVAAGVEQSVVNYLVLDAEGVSLDDDFVVTPNTSDNGISVLATAELGEYRLVAYIEPSDKYYPAIVEVPLYVREAITPAELYIHGHFCDRYYDLTNPVKMVKNGKVFTANDILIGYNEATADKAYDFVFSTHKLDLAEAPEQSMMRAAAAAGSHQWEALTEGFVYHNPMGNVLTATPAAEITEAAHLTPIHEGEDAAGKAGFYQFTVDFSQDAAAPTYEAVFTGDVTTGVEGVVVESAADAVYYDLTGRRVLNPSTGIVIRVQGGKAEKIMLK